MEKTKTINWKAASQVACVLIGITLICVETWWVALVGVAFLGLGALI